MWKMLKHIGQHTAANSSQPSLSSAWIICSYMVYPVFGGWRLMQLWKASLAGNVVWCGGFINVDNRCRPQDSRYAHIYPDLY